MREEVIVNSQEWLQLDHCICKRTTYRVYQSTFYDGEWKKVIAVVSTVQFCPEDLKRESDKLIALKSTYTFDYYGIYQDDSFIYILMEYMENKSLKYLLLRHYVLTEVKIREIAACCLRGLDYYHSCGYLHCEVTPSNLYVMNDFSVKLGDFCVESYLEHKYVHSKSPYGTPRYMAPEVFEGKDDEKSDVWSLGVTLLELAEHHPYAGCTESELAEKLKGPSPRLSDPKWSPAFVDFVGRCLEKDVKKRASVRELLEHPFVKGLLESEQQGASWSIEELKRTPPLPKRKEREVIDHLKSVSIDSFLQFDSDNPEDSVRGLWYVSDRVRMDMEEKWTIIADLEDRWMAARERVQSSSLFDRFCGDNVLSTNDSEHNQVLDLSDEGDRWEGDVLNGKPCGWGVLYDGEGERVYEGFRMGEVNVCYGRSFYGDIGVVEYEGGVCGGKRCGRGVLYDRSGGVLFDGEWVNDEHPAGEARVDKRRDLHSYIQRLLIYSSWAKEQSLTPSLLSLLPHLEFLHISNLCFSQQCVLTISGMKSLKRVVVGKKSFNQWSDSDGDVSDTGFCIENCPQLQVVTIGNRSFTAYTNCTFRNLPSLQELRFGDSCFQHSSLELEDLPRLTSLQFGEKCFCSCHTFVLANLPKLESVAFKENAFCFFNEFVLIASFRDGCSPACFCATIQQFYYGSSLLPRDWEGYNQNKLVMRDLPKLRRLIGRSEDSFSFRFVRDVTVESSVRFRRSQIDVPRLEKVVLSEEAFECKKICHVKSDSE